MRIPSASLDIRDHLGAFGLEASGINGIVANPWHQPTSGRGSELAIGSNHDRCWTTTTRQEALCVPKPQGQTRQTLRQYSSVTEHIFGTVYIRSKTSLMRSRGTSRLADSSEVDCCEHQSSLEFRPPGWLVNLGVKHGLRLDLLRSPTQGWKQTLKPFCSVPDDALIFDFCAQGNIPAVRALLSKGDASVRDTDSLGLTALHVSHEPCISA